MSSKLNFYIKKIEEISSDNNNLSKELIFYLKEKLGLSDISIFIEDYKLPKEEKNSNFIIYNIYSNSKKTRVILYILT